MKVSSAKLKCDGSNVFFHFVIPVSDANRGNNSRARKLGGWSPRCQNIAAGKTKDFICTSYSKFLRITHYTNFNNKTKVKVKKVYSRDNLLNGDHFLCSYVILSKEIWINTTSYSFSCTKLSLKVITQCLLLQLVKSINGIRLKFCP